VKLRTRLLAGVSLYQLLLIGVGLIGLLAAQASLRGMDVAVEHHVAELAKLGALTSEVDHIHSLALLHGLTDSVDAQTLYENEITQSEARAASYVRELVAIQERFGDAADAEQIRDFRRSWTAYLRVQDEQLLALTGADHDDEIDALTGPDGPLTGPYAETTAKLVALQARLAEGSTSRLNEATEDFERNRDLLLFATVLAGCLGIAFGWHQSARLAHAVEAVSQAARRVAGGDLTQHVPVTTGGDEIESLATSFNIMTTNLHEMTAAQNAHLSELQSANQALRESETRFRSVTQSVKEAILSMALVPRQRAAARGQELGHQGDDHRAHEGRHHVDAEDDRANPPDVQQPEHQVPDKAAQDASQDRAEPAARQSSRNDLVSCPADHARHQKGHCQADQPHRYPYAGARRQDQQDQNQQASHASRTRDQS
jgi:methyl-accepting chemotaxis protein